MEHHLSEFFTDEIARQAGLGARRGEADPLVTGLEYDSRKAGPGSLFFALPGLHTDGHRYIAAAAAKGAAVVVHEAAIDDHLPGVVYLQVKNSRFAMSPVSAAFYGFPSRRLIVAGVTGTEGKSTTVYLIYQLLRLLGKKAGFFSTVQYCLGGEVQWNPEHQTTPEATAVQRLLREMADKGCEYAVVEASSHGLSERTNRLGDVEFRAAVCTNVTHEHLEFHGTWEQYRDDKANLFRALDRCASSKDPAPFGIINADDKSADYFAGATQQRTLRFSVKGKDADLSLRALESDSLGNWYDAFIAPENNSIDIRDRLPGAFNAGNLFAALLAVQELTGIPLRKFAPLASRLQPVRGRMTSIVQGQPFELVVDYAHTPSSFRAIFPPLRERLNRSGGRLISLFGSAGERDIQKRAGQGRIASEYSDIIVLADEDPRGERPMDILEEIAKGCEADQGREADRPASAFRREENLFLIPDRPAAIRKALSLAGPGDMVLLLGKGHENSIIYADRTMPYDEISEAEKALSELGYGYKDK
ncbi:MAG: UDP-N-acetylmuramoyl-L-alanyl-D-glutamate--2,6-diaminopimelate ligase [Treponema sp.]|jgi:UDP-N-acetylmuramoyl-L-alanyl-D-glutamate--2,6-diaminopimelate ligase|nr:UDP-N-acetylmuramoyl-L-alanyl-D-glutamate--2,6-diaminopimelate ligase [Treponema sp.]